MSSAKDYEDLLEGVDLDDLDDLDLDDNVSYYQASDGKRQSEQDAFSLEIQDPATPIPLHFGFKTARGSALGPPSASALARAQRLFDDIEGEQSTSTRALESPSELPIGSQESLPANSKSMVEVLETPAKRRKANMSGFTTAGGKSVPPPSRQSMQRVMALFQEDDALDTSSGIGVPAAAVDALGKLKSSDSSTPSLSSRAKVLSMLGETDPTTPAFRSDLSPFRSPLADRTLVRSSVNVFKQPTPIKINSTPKRLGTSTRSLGGKRPRFITPFKPNVSSPQPSTRVAASVDASVFDLTNPPHRKSMRATYLKPGFYSAEELKAMGLPDEIWTLDISNARNYSFIAQDASLLGSNNAFTVLQREGCRLASSKWVDNHWSLVLWKLAGQVQAQPSLFDLRWNWAEVIEQLKYRYEREFLAVQKPIIRKIQEHDASAASSMVLVVSAIHRLQQDGKASVLLELTDGWYRIRAEIDARLTTAVESGRIAVGRKLSMVGAKLQSPSEGTDVLDALEKSVIRICANSCHLARWDTRLGVHLPFIASLSSISVDGGMIGLMGIIIEKLYPVAFVSSNSDDSYEPPWNEQEEADRNDRWKEAYSSELSNRADIIRRSLQPLRELVDLLVQAAQEAEGTVENGEFLEDVDDLFEKVYAASDFSSCLRTLTGSQVIALAKYGQQKFEREMATGHQQAEQEAQIACPLRQRREFRTIRFVDMFTGYRTPFREGMLNVWESKSLKLKEGQKYFVSSVYPSKSGDWMIPKTEGAKKQIYLHTRRDTRWQPVT